MGPEVGVGEVGQAGGRVLRADEGHRVAGLVGREGGRPARGPGPVDRHRRVPLQDRPAQQEHVEVVARVIGVQVGEEDGGQAGQQPGPAQLPGDAAAAVDQVCMPVHDHGLGDARPGRRRKGTAGRAQEHQPGGVRRHGSDNLPASSQSRRRLGGMAVIDADLVVALAVEGGHDLSYGDWERRSNAVARGLAGRRIGPGDRVVLRFDGRRWADYAVADLAVRKAGARAVPLTPGATRADVERAVSDPPAAGVLCPPDLVPPGLTVWAASPGLVGEGEDGSPSGLLSGEPGPVPGSPAPAGPGLAVDGPLVHAWPPGSPAGGLALEHAARGNPVTALAVFDPDRLCAAIARRRAVACGLSPALAAALVAAGAPRRHDVSAVAHVLLSGTPSPELRAALTAAFPDAAVAEVGSRDRSHRWCAGGGVPGGHGVARAVHAGQLQPPVPGPALPRPSRRGRAGMGVRRDGPPPRAAADDVRGAGRRRPPGGRRARRRRAHRRRHLGHGGGRP